MCLWNCMSRSDADHILPGHVGILCSPHLDCPLPHLSYDLPSTSLNPWHLKDRRNPVNPTKWFLDAGLLTCACLLGRQMNCRDAGCGKISFQIIHCNCQLHSVLWKGFGIVCVHSVLIHFPGFNNIKAYLSTQFVHLAPLDKCQLV